MRLSAARESQLASNVNQSAILSRSRPRNGRGCLGLGQFAHAKEKILPPVRVITKGPKHHWFGYYDKFEFDPTDRYVLGMEVDFEHRQPTPDDEISVGMVDLQDGDRWIELGRTKAWCWQQGCMLQWIPGITIGSDLERPRRRSIRQPHPRRKNTKNSYATVADLRAHSRRQNGSFGRLQPAERCSSRLRLRWHLRQNFNELVPDKTGVYHVDMKSGEKQMLFSVAEIVHRGPRLVTMKDAKHYFIHLLANPYSPRFILLHRWIGPQGTGTRMFTASLDGSDIRLIDANGFTSHFIWRDATHILAFSNQPSHGKRFYLFEDAEKGTINPWARIG